MVRSASFFEKVEDATMLAMLLGRIMKVTDKKMDAEELLEKAEIRFLEMLAYEAGHSEERLRHILANADLDLETAAEIARCFSLAGQHGPVFKCLSAYASLNHASVGRDWVSLLFWLELAASNGSTVGPLVDQHRGKLVEMASNAAE